MPVMIQHYELLRRNWIFDGFEIFEAVDSKQQKKVWIAKVRPELFSEKEVLSCILEDARKLLDIKADNLLSILEIIEEEELIAFVYPHFDGRRTLNFYAASFESSHIVQVFSRFAELAELIAPVMECVHFEPSFIYVQPEPFHFTWFLLPTKRAMTVGSSDASVRAGVNGGSFAYSSPEEVENKELHPSSYFFALGVLLLEIVFGKPVFRSDNKIGTLHNIIGFKPNAELLASIPNEWEDFTSRFLVKDPQIRLHDSKEFREHLTHLLGESVSVPPPLEESLYMKMPRSAPYRVPSYKPHIEMYGERPYRVGGIDKEENKHQAAATEPEIPAIVRGRDFSPPKSKSQSGLESTEDAQERTLRRKGVVRHYEQMNPGKIFPLLVSILEAELYIKTPELPNVVQTESERVMKIKERSPHIRIVPVIPGCIISPAEAVVDVREKKVDVEFWIAPQSEGDLCRSARIQLWHEGTLKDEISIPCRVRTHTLTKLASAASVVSSVSGAFLEAYGSVQVQNGAPVGSGGGVGGYLAQKAVLLLTSSGMWLGLLFLFVAFLCYLWLRPKRGDVIEHFLHSELH